MRALIVTDIGEPADIMQPTELPDPTPGPGEILVRVYPAPVHASVLHVLRGRFGRQPKLPASPGMEAAGLVQALGAGIGGPAIGTRVVLLNVGGTWRDKILALADRIIAIPDQGSGGDGPQALLNPVTAWVMARAEHR